MQTTRQIATWFTYRAQGQGLALICISAQVPRLCQKMSNLVADEVIIGPCHRKWKLWRFGRNLENPVSTRPKTQAFYKDFASSRRKRIETIVASSVSAWCDLLLIKRQVCIRPLFPPYEQSTTTSKLLSFWFQLLPGMRSKSSVGRKEKSCIFEKTCFSKRHSPLFVVVLVTGGRFKASPA